MDQELILHTSRGEGSFLFGYFLVWGHGNDIWLSLLCDCLNEKHAEFVMLSMLNFLGFKTEFVMLYLLNFLGLKTEIVMLYMLFFFFFFFFFFFWFLGPKTQIWCIIICMKNMQNFLGFHA